ncbi:hypothetical protein NEUTE1DRAFT_119051 [Neurospora tetrasperma FGSC 2508]|uniref:Uncharacterized protein n=1 Tax=Neurospora tetrasperma (strain FGSC 2508 / ATCC MYA-4615 / P0657) TaxID=510951 RepID=F8N125_NEUT8|nr:uncharacterized protein NEUTE1DRAFT_119051 [Neurospora tetrasperma FGSC 2508]EGO53058.1 hypothetical protein NEUTE1DRAFT_119051 [Neurospora tetrasperma FGSC 2508]
MTMTTATIWNAAILGRFTRVSPGTLILGQPPRISLGGCCGAYGTLRWRPITPFLDDFDNNIGNGNLRISGHIA